MKVLMFLIADHASIESQTGKLNILGAFRSIHAINFPVRHRAMVLVLKLGGERDDKANPHILKIALADSDGQELFNISGQFNMPDEPDYGIQPEFNAVIEIRDQIFKVPNTYTFFVEVDGKIREAMDIVVAQTPPKSE